DLRELTAAVEMEALNIIKHLRCEYLVTTSAAWPQGDHLVIEMELADATLWDVFREAKNQGRRGIDCEELFGYLRDAAEGIDFLNERRHVREGAEPVAIGHRDVKPQNLLRFGRR